MVLDGVGGRITTVTSTDEVSVHTIMWCFRIRPGKENGLWRACRDLPGVLGIEIITQRAVNAKPARKNGTARGCHCYLAISADSWSQLQI